MENSFNCEKSDSFNLPLAYRGSDAMMVGWRTHMHGIFTASTQEAECQYLIEKKIQFDYNYLCLVMFFIYFARISFVPANH